MLALMVLLGHAPEMVDGNRHRELLTLLFHTASLGEVAVAGFLVLSGFLILQSWQQRPQLGDFLRKRVLHIYPAFVVASLISAFIVGPLGAQSPTHYLAEINPVLLTKSIALLRMPDVPGTFLGQPHGSVNGAMWTIEMEFRCYLLVALLGLCGLSKNRYLWLGLSVLILGLFAFPHLKTIRFRGERLLFANFPAFVRLLGFFLAGGCFYFENASVLRDVVVGSPPLSW